MRSNRRLLVIETIARQRPHHPRRAFQSISHVARVWFLCGLVFVASQWRSWSWLFVWSVEPRGPASPIGVLDIQMIAVMRREFGTAEPPSSEVELGRGRAGGLVHVRSLPTRAVLFCPFVFRSTFDDKTRNRTIEHYTLPIRLRARAPEHKLRFLFAPAPRHKKNALGHRLRHKKSALGQYRKVPVGDGKEIVFFSFASLRSKK